MLCHDSRSPLRSGNYRANPSACGSGPHLAGQLGVMNTRVHSRDIVYKTLRTSFPLAQAYSGLREESMPWRQMSVMEQKEEFILLFKSGKYTVSALAQMFEIS